MKALSRDASRSAAGMPGAIEKQMEQPVQRSPLSLPVASVIGTLYIVAAYLALHHLLPGLWQSLFQVAPGQAPSLINSTLLVLTIGVALAGLVWAYPRVVPAVPGAKAGVAAGVIFVLAGFITKFILSLILDALFGVMHRNGWLSAEFNKNRWLAGVPIILFFVFLWLRWGWRLLHDPKIQRRLIAFEEQGWFETGSYKPNQGRTIRRLTFLALVVLAAGGFYHFWASIQRGMTGTWHTSMPFTDDYNLILAYMPGLVLTTVLALLTLWIAYRAVNAPVLADFLIATSAEMQKVTWSTRPQIVRDTIVVLVVTAILAGYLLLMDVFWVVLLRFFGVLKH